MADHGSNAAMLTQQLVEQRHCGPRPVGEAVTTNRGSLIQGGVITEGGWGLPPTLLAG